MSKIASLPLDFLYPEVAFENYLKNNVREDGRGFFKARPLEVVNRSITGQAPGGQQGAIGVGGQVVPDVSSLLSSSQCHLGNSFVLCVLSLSQGVPDVSAKNQGDLVCNVATGHLFTSINKENPRNNKSSLAVNLEDYITSVFNKGGVFDLTQLCISEGKFSFRIHAHITVLNNDGNLRDAATHAILSALRTARIPAAIIKNNQVTVDYSKTQPLKVRNVLPLTIGVYNEFYYIDPTAQEEKLSKGLYSIVLDMDDDSIRYLSLSSPGYNRTTINRIIELSKTYLKGCLIE